MENNDQSIITMAFAGDIMLGRLVSQAIGLHTVDYPWWNTSPLLTNADFDQIAERMQSLSSELGNNVDRLKDRLAIDLRQSYQPLVKQAG